MKNKLVFFITLLMVLLIPITTNAGSRPDCEEERLYFNELVSVKNSKNEKLEGSIFEWRTKMIDLTNTSKEDDDLLNIVFYELILISKQYTVEGYDINKELVYKFESDPTKTLDENMHKFYETITPEMSKKAIYGIYRGVIDPKDIIQLPTPKSIRFGDENLENESVTTKSEEISGISGLYIKQIETPKGYILNNEEYEIKTLNIQRKEYIEDNKMYIKVQIISDVEIINNKIEVPQVENGKVKYTQEDNKIKLDITPEEGYEIDKIFVKTADGNLIELIGNTFEMPNSDVTIEVSFKQIEELENPETGIFDSNIIVIIVCVIASIIALSKIARDNKYRKI